MLAEFMPTVRDFHFGLPSDQLLGLVRPARQDHLIGGPLSTRRAGSKRRGSDAIIAQGLEQVARGSFLSDDPGQPARVRSRCCSKSCARRYPRHCAGGIADATDVAAAMALGAAAVQIGTAYLTRPEATLRSGVSRALKSGAARAHGTPRMSFLGAPHERS